MSLYQKKITVGRFAKKDEDYKNGDIVVIANEGKKIEGKFGEQDVFLVKLVNGEEKNITFNQTTLNNLIEVFGQDSKNWIGKEVKVWLVIQNVQGKRVKVTYLASPAWVMNEGEGELFIDPAKDEPAPEDIPF